MKKLVFSVLMMFFGLTIYAQNAPAQSVKQNASTAKVIDTPEQEAKKLVDMLTQSGTYSDAQKKDIYAVALNAVKQRKAIASLRTTDPEGFARKEMEIFTNMSQAIRDIEKQ